MTNFDSGLIATNLTTVNITYLINSTTISGLLSDWQLSQQLLIQIWKTRHCCSYRCYCWLTCMINVEILQCIHKHHCVVNTYTNILSNLQIVTIAQNCDNYSDIHCSAILPVRLTTHLLDNMTSTLTIAKGKFMHVYFPKKR